MINFSGSTKKRVVNLGNRRSGTLASGNFLERSRLQRLEKEELRNRIRATEVLQCHIRRYLELTRYADSIVVEWSDNNVIKTERQWIDWLRRFKMVAKWYFPRQDFITVSQLLRAFRNHLEDSNWPILEVLFNSVMQTLGWLLERYSQERQKFNIEEKVVINNQIIGCITLLLHKFNPNGYNLDVPGISSALCDYIERFDISESEQNQAVDLVFTFAYSDRFDNFIKVLEIAKYHSSNFSYLQIIQTLMSRNDFQLPEFEQISYVKMLSNFLVIHGGEIEFSPEDFRIINSLLENIKCVIGVQGETDMEEDTEEVETGKWRRYVYVESEISSQLEILYSSKFVRNVIDLLTDYDIQFRDLALKILAKLVSMYPPLKGKICMLISITPNSYTWFFDSIRRDPLFKLFTSKGIDYVKRDQLQQLSSKLGESSVESFWNTVFLFEESYSYWLIVSNDLESFSDDKLSIEETKQFLDFLKILCLTLIFINDGKYFPSYSKLKRISLALLNQLYLKNLRMNFLAKDYWIPKELVFSIEILIRYVSADEERKFEEEAQQDDEVDYMFEDDLQLRHTKKLIATPDILAKVEILKKLPYFIAFKDRVRIFQALIELDRKRFSNRNPFAFEYESRISANIRRDHLLVDAFEQFSKSASAFKKKISVVFFNEWGQEAGIDGGGITKEFLTSVVKEGFSPDNELRLFKETYSHNQVYPNENIYQNLKLGVNSELQQIKLAYLRFLGMVIGKCFFENVLVDISFAPFFLNKWCSDNMKNSINDLSYLDNELFVNLMKLTRMSDEELEALDLNFTIDEKVSGKTFVFDLMPPHGHDVQVTSSNVLNYIHQLSNFKLNQSLRIQTKYFLEGLFSMINANWLSMFDGFELQMLISGGESDVNIEDWKDNVEYGGYLENDLSVQYFWEIVGEMTAEERFKLIKFVTSVSRAPLLGFGSLSPRFGIRNSGSEATRLPTASTCVNLLKLPDYRNKKIMREKLLYAINTESGFDLS
ncbi:HUL5 [[Candida] subhashii]|uniref:HECT-type E3 ubiquitin transferase n=1 Tax=[Candida] subhashii TaxID=561895 RepID=A0A8J5UR26_9ASCO|nr:HUL5 [[Candida] subhashii]KAG7665146.1 HUL5 [[Candida] subhashii]